MPGVAATSIADERKGNNLNILTCCTGPTVGSYGVVGSSERGTPVHSKPETRKTSNLYLFQDQTLVLDVLLHSKSLKSAA